MKQLFDALGALGLKLWKGVQFHYRIPAIVVSDALAAIGLILLTYGLYRISLTLALIVLGTLLLIAAYRLECRP